jgi:hypothetical protein
MNSRIDDKNDRLCIFLWTNLEELYITLLSTASLRARSRETFLTKDRTGNAVTIEYLLTERRFRCGIFQARHRPEWPPTCDLARLLPYSNLEARSGGNGASCQDQIDFIERSYIAYNA